MNNEITDLVVALWAEQYRRGIGPDDPPDPERALDWVRNSPAGLTLIVSAARGDVESLAVLRTLCGLPILS